MPIRLVSDTDTYDVVFDTGEEKPKRPTFTLKKLSSGEVNRIDDQMSEMGADRKMRFLAGTAERLKVKYAVVGWKNVLNPDGSEAPCNDTSKQQLPAKITTWLADIIDEDSGLKGIGAEERKK